MNKETPVPDWMLERYLLDELPRKERRRMERRLEQDAGLRAELDKLRAADRQFLSAYPAEQIIPQILSRARLARTEPAPARRRSLAWVAVPALATAVLLLVIVPPLLQRRLGVAEDPGEYTGIKGGAPQAGPALQVFLQRSGAEEALRSGDRAQAGDVLQLAYLPGRARHGVILSIDGAGGVTLHFPACAECDTTLEGGRRTLLANSFELDQAPRFERFFFITAREPLPTVMILEKAGTLAADRERAMTGPLDLPARFAQLAFLVRK
ncbi:MAG: hypothetical protein MUC72_01575 [Acidobacteria bacterium]|nr:hypothetical protein [Acidobacteriota bacterium]